MSQSSPSTKRHIFAKRHYEALASALAASRPSSLDDKSKRIVKVLEWELTVSKIISMLEQDNPAFNASRFQEACHLVSFADV